MNKAVMARNLLLASDLAEARRALDGAGVPWLAVKGAIFAFHLYENPGLRPMEDIDLVTPEAAIPEARRALLGLGYEPVDAHPSNLRRGPTIVDLEPEPWYVPASDRRGLWERSIVLEGVRTFGWEDHFAFVVAHSALHHGWWDETHAEDLRRLLRRELDWEAAAERLVAWRLAPAVDASLSRLGLAWPPALTAGVRFGPLERAEAAALLWALGRGQLPAVGHALRFWTAPDRLAHLRGQLFPGRSFVERRYSTSQGRLFAFLRPALLAARALRAAAETAYVLARRPSD